MTKLIFTNRFFYPDHSATSQLLSDLAFYLAKTGIAVHVITSRQVHDDPNVTLPSQDFVHGVQVTRLWATQFGRQNLPGRTLDYLTFYLSAAWSLFTLVKSGDVVVVKTDPPLISVVATVVVKIHRAKLINWIQDLFPEVARAFGVGGLNGLEGLLQSLRNWSLRAAYKNVVIGDGMAGKLTEEGIEPNTIQVIHNWADGSGIRPVDREKNDLRKAWNLGNRFVVGYSGNMGRVHEFGTILDAAERLNPLANVLFLFIGDGAQRHRLEEETRRRGLRNMMFKAYQPRELLGLSLTVPDIHLISLEPSMEGLIVPSKFYGIAAAGRPTIFIGSKNGEIPRILEQGQCGFSVKKGQAEELSHVIRDLADHLDRCVSLGERARTLFDQRFDMRHAMSAWEAVLDGVTRPVSARP
ncbi:MAG: glycosyltransferase family 4 protein [Nitrospirae bacterium]|nr:glycosyltransferase family 4 protein [Nitrospirota bacterium]